MKGESKKIVCAGGCGLTKTYPIKHFPFESNGCGRCEGWKELRKQPPAKGMIKEVLTGILGRWESMRQRLPTKFESAGTTYQHSAPYKPMRMEKLVAFQAEQQRLQDLLWQERARMEDEHARLAIEAAKEKLLRRHLPKERRVPAANSSPHMEYGERKFISLSGLRARHWSPKMIKTFLGEPDKLAPNPHYMSGPRMRLYERARVETAEKAPEWLAAKQKLEQRRRNPIINPLTRSANNID